MKDRLIKSGKKNLDLYKAGGIKGVLKGEAPVVKIGIIGTGRHSRDNLLPCLPHLPVKVVSACAKHRENAELYGSAYGATEYYDNYEEMFDQSDIDAVICCVNGDVHSGVIESALDRNLPLFVEKPAALNAELLETLVAKNSKNIISVGFQKRFAPVYASLKKFIDNEEYGKLHLLQMEFGVGAVSDRSDFIQDVGIHFIDLLRFLLPDVNLRDIKGKTVSNKKNDLLVTFESGDGSVIGTLMLSSNFHWNLSHERVFANFDESNVVAENLTELKISATSKTFLGLPTEKLFNVSTYENRTRPNFTPGTPTNSSLEISGFLPELRYFIDCVITGKKQNISDLKNAMETQQLVERIINV